ncbi:hypothetical protein CBR_g41201 [Chara braunii]|uniref:CCHC-type domain-containing protein n=1 Tax=Chara braunii TaxID=69332 RepID=A0A388K2J3_CHABU|nr:hypothetical protein CBR_g41201 [Chara braunii]|eukprot:GBG64281.1 hypothetical protein CBR_g41201 [Chara braunii]
MSGSSYREQRREGHWGRHPDVGAGYSSGGGRDYGREDRRDRYGDARNEHATPRDHGDYREQPRRFVPVCYECGEPGHYRNQCPKLVGESSGHHMPRRGRSTSPTYHDKTGERRSASEDPAVRKQLEDLASSIAGMKSFIDAEQQRKEDKARAKMEKEMRAREEKERVLREEEERLTKERRLKKKERRKETLGGGGPGGVAERPSHGDPHAYGKRKEKVPVHASAEEDSHEFEGSEIEALSEQAERLIISEKRKRGADRTIGDSPPMETPAKRTASHGALDPKRLLLSVRRQPMKTPPTKKTPRSRRGKWGAKKVPASPDMMGFVTDNIRDLGERNIEELKHICREESVPFEGLKKMDMILAITEKRSNAAFNTEVGNVVATEATGEELEANKHEEQVEEEAASEEDSEN